jgi:hypothetical protein
MDCYARNDSTLINIINIINMILNSEVEKSEPIIVETEINGLFEILELNFNKQKHCIDGKFYPEVKLVDGVMKSKIELELETISKIHDVIYKDIFDVNQIKEIYSDYQNKLRELYSHKDNPVFIKKY